MLNGNEHGYAVMNKELTAYSFEDTNLETCKRYCRNDSVIVKCIPYVAGFSIKIMCYQWYKPFEFKIRWRRINILWFHFNWNHEYLHKIGEIVYKG